MSVQIITDSACDLPKEILQEYGIDLIPLIVTLGEEEYQDGITIEPLEILSGMREGKVYKTSQASPASIREVFLKHTKQGSSCIYVAFSSELSGTYRTAVMMKNELEEEESGIDIDIVDTQCASLGFGLVVLKAAQMAKEGRSKDEILQAVQQSAQKMEHIFTVDDLEYLFRGGRVSKAAAVVGGLLNIKPILHVEDGKLIPLEKLRGRKKAIARMVDLMEERGANLSEQLIGISHGDDLEAATTLKEMIQERFGSQEFLIHTIGGAVGAHAGPGTLALFFLGK